MEPGAKFVEQKGIECKPEGQRPEAALCDFSAPMPEEKYHLDPTGKFTGAACATSDLEQGEGRQENNSGCSTSSPTCRESALRNLKARVPEPEEEWASARQGSPATGEVLDRRPREFRGEAAASAAPRQDGGGCGGGGPACWDPALREYRARVPELKRQWDATFLSQAAGAIPEHQLAEMRREAFRGFHSANRKGVLSLGMGGAHSYSYIQQHMPTMTALYRDPAFVKSLENISGRERLTLSRDSDPHAMAIYYYSDPGDYIGWHYDTSMYHGDRLTLLIPIFDNSSCELQCEFMARDLELLGRGDEWKEVATQANHGFWGSIVTFSRLLLAKPKLTSEDRARQTGGINYSSPSHRCRSLRTTPGEIIFFDGDKVKHRVTALGENELRVMLSFEYVTTQDANPIWYTLYILGQMGGYFGHTLPGGYIVVFWLYSLWLLLTTGLLAAVEALAGKEAPRRHVVAAVSAGFVYFAIML